MFKDIIIFSILVIGFGLIIIGQVVEFDYLGIQGCMVLKEEGYCVIFVNNNLVMIMMDEVFVDEIYFELFIFESIEVIIEKEKLDGLFVNLGGQIVLNLVVKFEEVGVLKKYYVKFLGILVEII